MIIKLAGETLCDGCTRAVDKSAGEGELRTECPTSVQVAEFLRAVNAQPIDRQNKRYVASFSVVHLCATEEAAGLYCWMHPATVTRSGTLTAQGDAGGQTISVANTVLENVVCTRVGASVFVTYSIQGGATTVA